MTGATGRTVAVVVAVCVWLLGAPALAQSGTSREDEASARLHFDRGSKLYEQGKYLEAAREFEAGYRAAPRPLFLLNIGHSYRRAQDLRQAKAAYEKLLRTDPTTPQRPMVEDLIKTIDDALTVQELAVPLSPAGPTRPVPGGAGLPSGREPSAPSTVNVVDTSAPPLPPAPSSSWRRSPWLWGILAGVVTAGVAGTVFALTRSPSCPANTCWKEF
jgi:tetratricopeptide (TPR) repeat protein